MNFNMITTSPHVLVCRHCNFSTDFNMVFTRHMLCHFTEKGYECPLCVVVSASEEELKQHVNTHLETRSSGLQARLQPKISTGQPNNSSVSAVRNFSDVHNTTKWAPSSVKSTNTSCKGLGKNKATSSFNASSKYVKRKNSFVNIVKESSTPENSHSKLSRYSNSMPESNCFEEMQVNEREQSDIDDGIYDPIDPIATTNKTLSYTDFYKKQSFLNVNNSLRNSSSTMSFSNYNMNNLNNDQYTEKTMQTFNNQTNSSIPQVTVQSCSYSTNQSELSQSSNTYSHLTNVNSCQSEPLPLIVTTRDESSLTSNCSSGGIDTSLLSNNSLMHNVSQVSNCIGNYGNMNGKKKGLQVPEKGSGGASEHITVKIDPFDVAPNMVGVGKPLQSNSSGTPLAESPQPPISSPQVILIFCLSYNSCKIALG